MVRQDPDVVMVGEIRDIETANVAIQAALTGHLVFSTLHTRSAAGSVTRLINMGVQPFLINSSFRRCWTTAVPFISALTVKKKHPMMIILQVKQAAYCKIN